MNQKVLFILHIPPPVHGSSMVGQFIKQSKRINSEFSARYLNLLASKDVSDSGKVSLVKISSFVKIWFILLKELIKYKPDLCYLAITCRGHAFFRDVLLIFLLKLFRVNLIYHMHNKGVSEVQEYFIYNFFYHLVFKGSNVILLSKFLYPDIEKYVAKEQIYICPNGIPEIEQFKLISNEQSNKVRILFLSNLIETKGVKILLEACNKLKDKSIEFECIYIGGEGDISSDQINAEIQSMNLSDCVTYMGKKYGKEKEQEFTKADIFAFPTFYEKECFPLVLLEAQQHSLPIISTYEGGIQDIVESGKNGYLVPQRDVDELTNKLELLIQKPEIRTQMGNSARNNYIKKFTLERFENRMLEILKKSLTVS
ncbi:MAG: glycosyltransferase family 4 protein [Balneola sp.]|nr:glycosyltransferase family 4 protein [Balneola sp.]